jgi:hypothetical protein
MSSRNPNTATRAPSDEAAASAWDDLPVSILERLKSESIHGPGDWLALSRARRAGIFGITPVMRRAIDAAAKASAEQSQA